MSQPRPCRVGAPTKDASRPESNRLRGFPAEARAGMVRPPNLRLVRGCVAAALALGWAGCRSADPIGLGVADLTGHFGGSVSSIAVDGDVAWVGTGWRLQAVRVSDPERPVPLGQTGDLGQAVDRFRIMTYDYHWSGGGPGPVAPIYWCQEVMEYAKTLPNVIVAEENLYTCSQDTQEKIKQKIAENKLNRVVVASCTPRTHEPLFQNTIKEAGLNAYLFEMANIRDQCSWIHMHEPKAATKKAKDLVRMAIAKSRLLEPLENLTIKVNQQALVIGGGVTGMTAAIELARQGVKVHLLEKEKELGGNLRKLHYLPSGDDPMEHVKRLEGEGKAEKNITVHLGTTAKNIEGYVGNFKTTLSDGKEIEHGVVILAIGGQEHKPEGEYLYGKNKNVKALLEFKEMLKKGEAKGKSYVVVQCVGSREGDHPNCSRVCCTGTMTAATKVKDKDPQADVYVLFRDIRTYGFREKYYKEASQKGVRFVRFDDERKPVVEDKGGKLEVMVTEEDTGKQLVLRPDYLVLASGTRPQSGAEELAPMLKVPMTKEGFFLEAHMKLRPVDFATEGVYLAGLAHGPKFVDESISQALATVSRAMTVLSKTTLEAEGIVASVEESLCDGCGICVPTCEYKALEIVAHKDDPKKKMVDVNVGLCKGCGACVGACPAGALTQKGFRDEQILAMIDAALEQPKKQEVKG